jgi:hypothetical protein
MPLEIAGLVFAVEKVTGLVAASAGLVKEIRARGLFTNNEKAKEELGKKLAELQANLEAAGKLSEAAEAYSRTRENVLELLWLCRRAQRFVDDYLEQKPADNEDPMFWRVLEEIFQFIESSRETPLKVMFSRADWFDEQDKGQMETLLNQFNHGYTTAVTFLRVKRPSELSQELRVMTARLQEADSLLQGTLYDKILRGLKKIS